MAFLIAAIRYFFDSFTPAPLNIFVAIFAIWSVFVIFLFAFRAEHSSGKIYISTGNRYGIAIDKGIGYLGHCRIQNTPHSLPGNIHKAGRIMLIMAIFIAKPHGFKFVKCQFGNLQLSQGNTLGLKEPDTWFFKYLSFFFGPWHGQSGFNILLSQYRTI